MLDVITLQARGQYKQDEYVQQADHERLLRQLPTPEPRLTRLGQIRPLLVGVAVLLLAIALRPVGMPVEAEPLMSVTTTAATPAFAPTHLPDCWVTGDLVGDGNPAEIARALCGR
jgi:hypothetical protein